MLCFQRIPRRWRHGYIRQIRVRYREVTAAGGNDWKIMWLSGSRLSVELPNSADLNRDKFYEVTVDATTEVGLNESLYLQSVILPSNAAGTADSL